MKNLSCLLLLLTIVFVNAQDNVLPKVDLKNLDGDVINVAELSEKEHPVILSFWATWCGPCIRELSAIQDVYEDWQDELNVELIAVSIDDSRTVKRVRPMVNGKGWDYEVLLDTNQELKRNLNIVNVPYIVVVYKGEVIYEHSQYTPGSEEEMYEKIKEKV